MFLVGAVFRLKSSPVAGSLVKILIVETPKFKLCRMKIKPCRVSDILRQKMAFVFNLGCLSQKKNHKYSRLIAPQIFKFKINEKLNSIERNPAKSPLKKVFKLKNLFHRYLAPGQSFYHEFNIYLLNVFCSFGIQLNNWIIYNVFIFVLLNFLKAQSSLWKILPIFWHKCFSTCITCKLETDTTLQN